MERSTIFNWKINYEWPFSRAMLVYQRVIVLFILKMFQCFNHIGDMGWWFERSCRSRRPLCGQDLSGFLWKYGILKSSSLYSCSLFNIHFGSFWWVYPCIPHFPRTWHSFNHQPGTQTWRVTGHVWSDHFVRDLMCPVQWGMACLWCFEWLIPQQMRLRNLNEGDALFCKRCCD